MKWLLKLRRKMTNRHCQWLNKLKLIRWKALLIQKRIKIMNKLKRQRLKLQENQPQQRKILQKKLLKSKSIKLKKK